MTTHSPHKQADTQCQKARARSQGRKPRQTAAAGSRSKELWQGAKVGEEKQGEGNVEIDDVQEGSRQLGGGRGGGSGERVSTRMRQVFWYRTHLKNFLLPLWGHVFGILDHYENVMFMRYIINFPNGPYVHQLLGFNSHNVMIFTLNFCLTTSFIRELTLLPLIKPNIIYTKALNTLTGCKCRLQSSRIKIRERRTHRELNLWDPCHLCMETVSVVCKNFEHVESG